MPDLLTPDQYMDLLVQRRDAWQADRSPVLGAPALVDWFIEPGDEGIVDMAAIEAQTDSDATPERPKKPRHYKPASHWRNVIDRTQRRMDAINGVQRHDTTDPAAYGGVGVRQTARQKRKYGEQIDKAASEYVRLDKQLKHAMSMLRKAEARER